MSRRVTLGAETPKKGADIEVELYDHLYTGRPITRSVQVALDGLDEKLDQATTGDAAVHVFAEMLDVLLTPANGKRKTAGKVILEQWEKDELSVGQIGRFFEQVQEAAAEGPRPT